MNISLTIPQPLRIWNRFISHAYNIGTAVKAKANKYIRQND